MQEVLHANIFFFITSVAVILVTIVTLFIGWEIWRLSRTLRRMAEKIENETDKYLEASEDLRERVFEHPLVQWILGKRKHARRSKREE